MGLSGEVFTNKKDTHKPCHFICQCASVFDICGTRLSLEMKEEDGFGTVGIEKYFQAGHMGAKTTERRMRQQFLQAAVNLRSGQEAVCYADTIVAATSVKPYDLLFIHLQPDSLPIMQLFY